MSDPLPEPRGELTEQLLLHLPTGEETPSWAAPTSEEDRHLALYLLYELYYRGLPGVDPDAEWRGDLIALRRGLETTFEQELFAVVGAPQHGCDPEEMDLALRAIEAADNSPSLSRFIERKATVDQVLEFMVHRSAYQLKEADPHSFALPRIWGPPKAAMVEIQADEYGGGRPERMHARLFADAMEAVGLDSTYGVYLDHIPGVALATVNLMSMLGLRRRWRGACVGHLALFEMTSSLPNGRYARGLRRLGLDAATPFFDEHVVADSIHENIAAVDLAGGLARQDPSLAKDILFGARALVHIEGRWSAALVDAFEAGRTSLRVPLAVAA